MNRYTKNKNSADVSVLYIKRRRVRNNPSKSSNQKVCYLTQARVTGSDTKVLRRGGGEVDRIWGIDKNKVDSYVGGERRRA
jgi:hypothetical protein